MIALSLQCEEPGVFKTNGVPWSERELARSICGDFRINLRALRELILNRVAKVSDDGTIYCKRVVEDYKKLQNAKENGKKGGNPLLKTQPTTPTPPLTLAGARSAAVAFASEPKTAAAPKNSPREPSRKKSLDTAAAVDQDRGNQPQAIQRLAHQFELAAECDHLSKADRSIFYKAAALCINGHIDRNSVMMAAEKSKSASKNRAGYFCRMVTTYSGGKKQFQSLLRECGAEDG